MKYYVLIFSVILLSGMAKAQEIDFEHFEDLEFRSIGPAGMSGRVTAIDVNLQNKDHIIIGSASGGVWESLNGGISWTPIFDDQPTLSIGAVKFDQSNPDVIWVGTGEGNPRNSHNSGAGIFRSIDGGKTWEYKGLKETKLIHRIIIDESNPSTVYVGAMGSAWGDSPHRGVYKTTDNGATWKKILYVDENVGIAEMVVSPDNPDKILAAMWEFRRTPWEFNSGGEGSGLFLTYDGGENWKEIDDENGLPEGHLGRMGLAFAPSDPDIVYALIEAEENGLYKSTDGGENWKLVSTKDIGNRPFYYAEIYVDPANENRIYNLWSYVSMSEDGGKTFRTIADYGNNVHPDHHAFWIDPDNPDFLIDGNDGGLNISRDRARSWQFIENLPLGQFYHVDIDNDFPYNIYGGMQDNGSWVGPAFVLKSGGIRNYDWQELYFGDGFDVAARKDDNRYGYAMSQGGNIAMWDKVTGRVQFIKPTHPEGTKLRYNWNAAMALHPDEPCGLFYGSQFVHRSMDCGKSWEIISPDLTTNDSLKQQQHKSGGLTLDVTGAENHTTILAIAPDPSDADELWVGTDDGNLQMTDNGGESWTLLNDRLPGLPANAWIPQIELSQSNPEEAFVVVNNYRMNDWSAYLFHTLDNGKSWKRVVNDSNVGGFVTSVVQDPEEPALVFLGTDVGLYVSFDHAASWVKWDKGLPNVQIRDMKIQTEFDDLVLGTFGRSFFVLDDITPLREMARSGMALLNKEFFVCQPGTAYQTSRRSYDGIRFIGQGEFVGENKSTGAVFTIWNKPEAENENPEAIKSEHKQEKKGKKRRSKEDKEKDEENPEDPAEEAEEGDVQEKKKDEKNMVKIMAVNENGDTVRTFERRLEEGMNRLRWYPDAKGVEFPRRRDRRENSEPGGMPILPGDYKMLFEYGDFRDSVTLSIELDPRIDIVSEQVAMKYEAMSEFNKVVETATTAFNNLKEAKKSLDLYNSLIALQEDSIRKVYKKQTKEISAQIDSLMNLYFMPESRKTEYRDSSETLNSYLGTARRYLMAADGAPGQNGMYAVDNARRKASEVISSINDFFTGPWEEYQESLKDLPLDIFKEFEEVHIE